MKKKQKLLASLLSGVLLLTAALPAAWADGPQGDGLTLILPAIEREGRELLGWYDAAEGGNLLGMPGESCLVYPGMDLYAHWDGEPEDGPVAYLLTLQQPGAYLYGTTAVTLTDGALDAALTLPIALDRGFDGYYTDSGTQIFDATGELTAAAAQLSGDTVLTARWSDNILGARRRLSNADTWPSEIFTPYYDSASRMNTVQTVMPVDDLNTPDRDESAVSALMRSRLVLTPGQNYMLSFQYSAYSYAVREGFSMEDAGFYLRTADGREVARLPLTPTYDEAGSLKEQWVSIVFTAPEQDLWLDFDVSALVGGSNTAWILKEMELRRTDELSAEQIAAMNAAETPAEDEQVIVISDEIVEPEPVEELIPEPVPESEPETEEIPQEAQPDPEVIPDPEPTLQAESEAQPQAEEIPAFEPEPMPEPEASPNNE